MRSFFYVHMSLVEDNPEVQRAGTVSLGYFVSKGHNNNVFELVAEKQRLLSAMPIKVKSAHACTDNPAIRLVMKACRPFLSKEFLSRTRIHCGNTHLECQYELLSYGIPLAALPVDSNGKCHNDFHILWIQRRHSIEQERMLHGMQSTSMSPVPPLAEDTMDLDDNGMIMPIGPVFENNRQVSNLHPRSSVIQSTANPTAGLNTAVTSTSAATTSNAIMMDVVVASSIPPCDALNGIIFEAKSTDVILGRGKAVDMHAGNVQFRNFMKQESLLNRYDNSKYSEKGEMADSILEVLQDSYNVRFITKQKSGSPIYHLADPSLVREKILRTLRRELKQAAK